jgi:hypothetical protein
VRRVVGTREGGIGPLLTSFFDIHAAMHFVNRELSPLLSSREILGNPCWDFFFPPTSYSHRERNGGRTNWEVL